MNKINRHYKAIDKKNLTTSPKKQYRFEILTDLELESEDIRYY